jgi:hypothetical protein
MTEDQIAMSGLYAEWFAAIGTVGALFLGVLILGRDRHQAVQASADSFVTWAQVQMTIEDDTEKWTVVVHAYNSGDRPIPHAVIVPRPGVSLDAMGFMLAGEPVSPGASVERQVEINGEPEGIPLWVAFQDARSRRWIRDLNKQGYVSKWTLRALKLKYRTHPVLSRHLLFPRKERRPVEP